MRYAVIGEMFADMQRRAEYEEKARRERREAEERRALFRAAIARASKPVVRVKAGRAPA